MVQDRPIFPPAAVGRLLSDSSTLATTLNLVLLTTYGEAVYEMDPLELYARVQDDFGVQMPEELENRWNAISLALTTDGFYQDRQAFVAICNALYEGEVLDPSGTLNDLTVPEILWAIYEVELNRDGPTDFSVEIDRFVDAQIDAEAEDKGMDSTEAVAYYDRFLDDMKVDLQTQLLSLGLDSSEIRQFVS